MSKKEQKNSQDGHKEFGISSLSVNNRKTVFLMAFLIVVAGISA